MYAVRLDKLGFRAIGSKEELMENEYFVEEITEELQNEINLANEVYQDAL